MNINHLQKFYNYTFVAEKVFAEAIITAETKVNEAEALFSHILNAQSLWSERIQGKPVSVQPFAVISGDRFHSIIEDHKSLYSEFLQELTRSEHARVIEYVNLKGVRFSSPLDDLLLHVFNHSTYHRAQINTVFRKNGITPIPSDYILFQRGEFPR